MTFACRVSASDTVVGRYGDEPGLSGAEICPLELEAAAPAFLHISESRGGGTNWNTIFQLCTNKLMNDNGFLIEGAGALPSADCGAAKGVLTVVMATGAERLWRSPDLSWSQAIFYTCSP